MKRTFAIRAWLLVPAMLIAALPRARAGEVLKITIDGTINPITDEYIERGVARAQQDHADAILIELSTPGGLMDSMRSSIQHILSSPVPVIVYVQPTGSRAASAGFFILESADVAAMAPGTNTGAAHPVLLYGKMDDVMKVKVENDAAAFLRSYVTKRNRNADLAETAVRQSKSFTDQEALNQHLIDLIAKDQNQLFGSLNGKPVQRFDGSTTMLNLAGDSVTPFGMTLKQQIMDYLMDPNISLILLVIGALAIYVEFNTPGAVVPGVIGFIAVLLAVFALHLLPTSFAGVALILGAFILFALEAKFQSHGVLTVGGTALLILGSLMLVDGPIPEMRVKVATALAVSIPFALITSFLMTVALRARRNKVQTGAEALIGQLAIVRMPLNPDGKVALMGELWNAVSSRPAEIGERVRVRAVNGLQLEVEPEKQTAAEIPQ